jgi:rhodanese-related sulfurtransferase
MLPCSSVSSVSPTAACSAYRATRVVADLLESGKATVLFDVRHEGECAVSHLPGAVRVDPDISAETFIEKHGALLRGSQAILYCSTGRRSSELIARLNEFCKAHQGQLSPSY